MVDPRIASGRDRLWKASVIRSEIRSRAELNCAFALFLHPSYQRDTAHRPIGTGRLRARRRFGYWGAQIGHLRNQSGHHFGARRHAGYRFRWRGVVTTSISPVAPWCLSATTFRGNCPIWCALSRDSRPPPASSRMTLRDHRCPYRCRSIIQDSGDKITASHDPVISVTATDGCNRHLACGRGTVPRHQLEK